MADTTVQGPVTGVNVGHLREQVRGRVITADDEGYNEARAVHNGMFDKRPLAVLCAEQVADVIAGVNFARDNGLDLSIRGGAHSAPGFGTTDDGLVIDMTPMRTVRVDPGSKTAHAGAGATWGDFNHATHAFGLATTGGIISTTGITGLTLGGGIGYLARGFGLSIDNLISADVVTADGKFVTASEHENEDLFWGLRGGGGNFGVVTSLEYRLHEVDQVFAQTDLLQPRGRRSTVPHVRRIHPGCTRAVRRLPGVSRSPTAAIHPTRTGARGTPRLRSLCGALETRPARPGGEGPQAVHGCRSGRRQRDGSAPVSCAERCVRRTLPQGAPCLLEGRLRQGAARGRHRGSCRTWVPGS